jgi:hypothetical protein
MSINGQMTPRQNVEEKVLKDDKTQRIVERTIRRYDPNGNPGPVEKVRIEETKNPDGSSRTVTTTSRSDINGNVQLAERETTEARTSNGVTTANSTLERRGTDGTLQTAIKRDVVTKKTSTGSDSEISTFQRDADGRFFEALRHVAQISTKGNESVSNLTEYRSREGKLELEGRTVTTTNKQPGGSEVSVVDVYAVHDAGQVRTPGQVRLLEQNIIERKPGIETLRVRETSPNNPGRLGAARLVLERVCTGDCK